MAQQRSEQVIATLEREGVRFINLEFTDVVGMAKSVTILSEQFADCIKHGKWFDGSSLEGFARIAESDMYLHPDLSTFAILPENVRPAADSSVSEHMYGETGIDDVVARVICDVRTPDGERFEGDPRATLQQAIEMARSMGFQYKVAPELEFF